MWYKHHFVEFKVEISNVFDEIGSEISICFNLSFVCESTAWKYTRHKKKLQCEVLHAKFFWALKPKNKGCELNEIINRINQSDRLKCHLSPGVKQARVCGAKLGYTPPLYDPA